MTARKFINHQSIRRKVFAVVDASPTSLRARDVARLAGLAYKQTIDALNSLYDMGKIERLGHKSTSRWVKKTATPPSPLDTFMLQMLTKQPSGGVE